MALNASVDIYFLGFHFVVEVQVGVWDVPGRLCEYCLLMDQPRLTTGYPFTVQVNCIKIGGCLLDPSSPVAYEVTLKALTALEHGKRLCSEHYHLHKRVLGRLHEMR